jgi:phage terminase large subunit-like protein
MTADSGGQALADGAQDDFTPWQAESVNLETRHTALLASRQTGKSYTLATRAAHWAFTRPRQEVLVISAREDTAKNLLRVVRQVAAHPMLRASIVEDLKTRLELSNASAVEAVASSEAAIRGRSVDLLICDEAAFIPAELIESAAIPTTMARPDARIVLASTPWGSAGTFYEWYQAGVGGDDPDTRSFRWRLADCPWITASVIESLRRRLSPLRFRAEVLGEWVGTGDSFLALEDIEAAVAAFPMSRDGRGGPAVLGADWGGDADFQAVAIAGVLDDGGTNGRPVIVVPWCEASRRGYTEQEDEIVSLAGRWKLDAVMSEAKGVGIPPTKNLRQKLTRTKVVAVKTTQEIKEQAYTRLQYLLAERQIVLPDHAELRKQLAGIVAKPTPLGGLRIEARTQSTHDDLADALAFAVWGLPEQLAGPPERELPAGTQWARTPGGIRIPLPVSTVRAELSYADMNGGYWTCPDCHLPSPVRKEACQWPGCSGKNPDRPAEARTAPPATAAQGEAAGAMPAGNWYNPDLMRCSAEHLFDGRFSDKCPKCSGGDGASPPGSPFPGVPGLATRLGGIIGPRR